MKRPGTVIQMQLIIPYVRHVWLMALLLSSTSPKSYGQQNNALPHQLTLQEAITLSKTQNKQVRAFRSEENAMVADLKDAKIAALPGLEFNGDY